MTTDQKIVLAAGTCVWAFAFVMFVILSVAIWKDNRGGKTAVSAGGTNGSGAGAQAGQAQGTEGTPAGGGAIGDQNPVDRPG